MKKALKIIFNVIAWIVLILALLVTVLVFSSDRNSSGEANLFGYIPLTVESDSMKPTFKSGDLIIVKEVEDSSELEVGDVITFWTLIDGEKVKNTHRIVEVNDDNGALCFTTKGDNNDDTDSYNVYVSDIIGKWTDAKLSGFGKVMDFLRTKTGFFVCILIPVALFFIFELIKLIMTIADVRRPKREEAEEEEIKKRAIEEFLAEQAKAQEQGEGGGSPEPAVEAKASEAEAPEVEAPEAKAEAEVEASEAKAAEK